MSVITNIIMQTNRDEEDFIARVQDWLTNNNREKIIEVSDLVGGSRAMELDVYMAAYNHFKNDEFLEFLCSIESLLFYPDKAVLIMQTHDDDSIVWRPKSSR